MSAIHVPESGESNRVLINPGTYIARCYAMVHIGTVEQEFQGQVNKMQKIRISFETPFETHVFKEENGPEPFALHKKFTLSLGDKSALKPFLEAWRGKKFTDEEKKKFDVSKLVGATCIITVSEAVSKNGKSYREIVSISPVMKGQEVPPMINKPFLFGYAPYDHNKFLSLPDFLKEEIEATPEYQFHSKKWFAEQGQQESEVVTEQEDEEPPF